MNTALFKQVAFGEWYKYSRNIIVNLRRQSRICPIGLALSVFNQVVYSNDTALGAHHMSLVYHPSSKIGARMVLTALLSQPKIRNKCIN